MSLKHILQKTAKRLQNSREFYNFMQLLYLNLKENMMKRKLLTALLFTLSLGITFAQRQVSGRVTSAEDGSALPGVNVVVVGSQQGSITDIDGKLHGKCR
jgi:hypothetical protein